MHPVGTGLFLAPNIVITGVLRYSRIWYTIIQYTIIVLCTIVHQSIVYCSAVYRSDGCRQRCSSGVNACKAKRVAKVLRRHACMRAKLKLSVSTAAMLRAPRRGVMVLPVHSFNVKYENIVCTV